MRHFHGARFIVVIAAATRQRKLVSLEWWLPRICMMFLNLKGPRGAMPRRWRYQSRRAAARFLLKLRLWFAVAVLVHREVNQINPNGVLDGEQVDKAGKEEDVGARKHKPNTKSRVMPQQSQFRRGKVITGYTSQESTANAKRVAKNPGFSLIWCWDTRAASSGM